jgi:chromate transporter
VPLAGAPGYPALAAAVGAAGTAAPLWPLTLFFLKVGALLYGSGYILVAYLEGGLVRDSGWLNSEQLMDAVAAGQVTPGPLISTATFVGYLLAGWSGAALATAAIMLPGLVLVALTSPYIPRLRGSAWTARFLDAVGAASIGVTAAVTVALARGTLVDWPSALIAAASAAVLLRWKLSPAWLILAGSLSGRLLWSI